MEASGWQSRQDGMGWGKEGGVDLSCLGMFLGDVCLFGHGPQCCLPVWAWSPVLFACLGVVLVMFTCCPILQRDLSQSWTFTWNRRAKDERLNQREQRRERERHDQPEWHFLQLHETVAVGGVGHSSGLLGDSICLQLDSWVGKMNFNSISEP